MAQFPTRVNNRISRSLEPAKFDCGAFVVFLEWVFPLREWRVQFGIAHFQQIVFASGENGLGPDLFGRAEEFDVRHALAILIAGALDDAVVVIPLRLDEEPLALLLVGFGFEDFRQAREVVGIALGLQDAIDLIGIASVVPRNSPRGDGRTSGCRRRPRE